MDRYWREKEGSIVGSIRPHPARHSRIRASPIRPQPRPAATQPPACKFVRIQYAQSTVTAQIPHSVKSAFPSHIRLPNPLSVPSMKDRLKKYRQVYIREIPHPESVSEGSRYEDEVWGAQLLHALRQQNWEIQWIGKSESIPFIPAIQFCSSQSTSSSTL